MGKIKQFYKGFFSYRSELSIDYAYAFSERQAKTLMCRRLAKKHDVSYQTVFGMFNGEKANYKIIIEMEVKECEENEIYERF